jgi:Protein of unknown function (DUF4058)
MLWQYLREKTADLMQSPFPGMDPFIEIRKLWGDFHTHLIEEIYRALSAVLPDRYVVRAGERSYVAIAQLDDDEQKQLFLPDIAVASSRRAPRSTRKPKGSATHATPEDETAPVVMRALIKAEYREPFLEIRQVDPDHKLVTGIEVLSPSNKRPGTKGWRLYGRKRQAYLNGYANFVEIDLLRQGRRMPMTSKWPDGPYYLLVCSKKQAPRCAVWPAFSTKRLPSIPIPLLPSDADITLDLQPLIDAIYERSRYQRDIDYRAPIEHPLSADEQALLGDRQAGRKT